MRTSEFAENSKRTKSGDFSNLQTNAVMEKASRRLKNRERGRKEKVGCIQAQEI